MCFSATAYGHEDLDIGIHSVVLDKQCRVAITLKNYGRPLPESFYRAVNPASLEIKKSDNSESLGAISALDKQQTLKKTGGQLRVMSTQQYTQTAAPLDVSVQFFGEFLDYGAANNTVVSYVDCVPGQGSVSGAIPPPTSPDLTIEKATIDPKSCLVSLVFGNLNAVSLGDYAWESGGVKITRLDPLTHIRADDVALNTIDPDKTFTRESHSLAWSGKLLTPGMSTMRVGLWYVRGDLNFDNNHLDLAVPERCRK